MRRSVSSAGACRDNQPERVRRRGFATTALRPAVRGAAVMLTLVSVLIGAAGTAGARAAFSAPKHGYIVYWDQNEEEDYYTSATHSLGQLETPWDPNGQMCIVPHTQGDYVVGYDPTNVSQHNPGGPPHHPFKQPPDGVELQNAHGNWTGQNLYVPGPFHQYKNSPGGDTPPDAKGIYNGQSTYTGCTTDTKGDVFGADIATAQGSFPVPSSGRLVEWFAPSYKSYCILYGPTSGGVGPHHVDGTGGLSQPGMMTTASNGDVLLPVAGAPGGQGIGGQVLRFDHTSFPTSAAQCPGGIYPREKIHFSVFLQGTTSNMPFPMAIAKDPTCGCYAVDTAFGTPAIEWFTDQGTPVPGHVTVPGETISELGKVPNGFNPFGMAFAPDGTLYFVDIHLQCQGTLVNCGPGNGQGRIMRIAFDHGTAGTPTVIDSHFDFPTSVTICVIGHGVCPFPSHATPKPLPTTKAEGG